MGVRQAADGSWTDGKREWDSDGRESDGQTVDGWQTGVRRTAAGELIGVRWTTDREQIRDGSGTDLCNHRAQVRIR